MFIVAIKLFDWLDGPKVEVIKRDGICGVGKLLSNAIFVVEGFGLISNASLLLR